jgi:hypothetical protein
MRNWPLVALVALSVALWACAEGQHARPELPQSVSPGWKLTSLNPSAAPAEVPAGGSPECWQAIYSGTGAAQIWLCRYSSETGAFDAAQRANAAAQTVKFQEGEYLVLAKWNNAPKADLTALIRAVQKTLNKK